MTNQSNISFEKMKADIGKAGNLFYQYRACRRDAETIYDIENIRHGQVYARTPLQMNDPFDSMIGFSPEKIYDECIDLVLSQAKLSMDQNVILILKNILKYRVIGKTIEFIGALNKLKKYIFTQSVISHVSPDNFPQFIAGNMDKLYRKCPPEIKQYFNNKQIFFVFSIIIKDYKNVNIEEKNIIDMLNMEDSLKLLEEKVVEVRDQIYLPFIKEFLSKLTVVCFSASGWDNQLMWAHYANSYSGICVEYDFEKMNKFIGFMYPVKYSCDRPTLTLRDLGIDKFETDESGKLKTVEPDMSAILSYMLSKNKCWEYEDEWRIINSGEQPYTPIFIDTPFIKSITMGLNLDGICKQLLWDVCQEKGIDCYQLVINSSDYHLTREKLTEESIGFNETKELSYINLLVAHTSSLSEKMSTDSKAVVKAAEEGSLEVNSMINVLTSALDFLSDAYFLKTSFNRYCKHMNIQESEMRENEQIRTAISQIDGFVSVAKLGSDSINENLGNLLITRKISLSDYHKAKMLLANILELVDKHLGLKVFGVDTQICVSTDEETSNC